MALTSCHFNRLPDNFSIIILSHQSNKETESNLKMRCQSARLATEDLTALVSASPRFWLSSFIYGTSSASKSTGASLEARLAVFLYCELDLRKLRVAQQALFSVACYRELKEEEGGCWRVFWRATGGVDSLAVITGDLSELTQLSWGK